MLFVAFVGIFTGCTALLACMMFGDANESRDDDDSRGWWSKRLRRYCLVEFPQHTEWIFKSILGERMYGRCRRHMHYFLYERNPILQYTYLTLVCGGYGLFVACAQPYIPNPCRSRIHLTVMPIVVLATLYSFVLACVHSPVRLTHHNVDRMDYYPYDQVLYTKRNCASCDQVRKPARSKHCATCHVCVARFDHHCGWLNQCIGLGNYRYFIAFVGMNSAFLLYAAFVLGGTFHGIAVRERLYEAEFVDQNSHEIIRPTRWIVFRYLIHQHPVLFMLLLMTSVMGLVSGIFFVFHCWLIWNNLTTNEFFKRWPLRPLPMTQHVYRLPSLRLNIHDAFRSDGKMKPDVRLKRA